MELALPPDPRSHLERCLLTVSYAAYVVCLAVPAFYANRDAWLGLYALLLGPIGVPLGYVSWLANPLLWYAWRVRSRGRHVRAIVACAFALPLALSFLLHPTIPVGSAGEYSFQLSFGYFLWLLSMVMALAAAYQGFCRMLHDDSCTRAPDSLDDG